MRSAATSLRPLLAAAAFLAISEARAGVTTERSSSLLVFPRIVANIPMLVPGTPIDGLLLLADTQIEIVNTSNSLVRAHCFYVNGGLANPEEPEGPLNPPLWQEVDFTISLTRQQPTTWSVARGRPVDPTDPSCTRTNQFCVNAGFDPGLIPPMPPAFEGELKCVEIDDSGAPLSGNHLIGTAVVKELSIGEAADGQTGLFGDSGYNAIGFQALENNGDGRLILGGGQCSGAGPENGNICREDEDCGSAAPCVLEYDACPETWILNHQPDGAPELVLEDSVGGVLPSAVETELTIVPCTQNFETQVPTSVTLQFLTTDEFEQQFSVSTTITCWASFRLAEVGATALTFAGYAFPDPQGTMFLQTRLRSAAATPFGVVMVATEYHLAPSSTSEDDMGNPIQFRLASPAAFNLHVEGERPVPDVVTIPADQLVP
jgi:hypothetical protein